MTCRQIAAVLGHELAHTVNGDPTRNYFLGTALYTLASWYELIAPRPRRDNWSGSAALLIMFVNLVALPLTGLVWLMGYILIHLLWYDTQRAEYLADRLGAQVSGTEALLTVLDKAHLQEMFDTNLKFAYLRRRGRNFFADLQQRASHVSPREIARLRWIEKLTLSRINVTHPPTAYRIEFLKACNIPEAKVVLSSVELSQLEQEFEPLLKSVEQEIFNLDEISFREVFKLSW